MAEPATPSCSAAAVPVDPRSAASLKRELREWMQAFRSTHGRGIPFIPHPVHLAIRACPRPGGIF